MSDEEGGTSAGAGGDTQSTADSRFMPCAAPKPGVRYPLQIQYCDVCDGWPIEYVEYHPNYAGAKEWMEKNLTDDMKELYLADDGGEDEGGATKKAQKRGGRGQIKTKKKAELDQKVCLARAPRGKKKSVTVVTGLATYEIDLKAASKFFGSRFACGSSVTGDDEIVIQGDVKDDLFDVIPEKWPQIDEENIDDLGDMKRS